MKKNTKKSPWSRPLPPEKRLEALNKQFKDLKLEDYLRKYTDRSKQCAYKIPSEAELNSIFNDMNKTDAESRKINCSCCGYATCKDMATAIYNGFNHKSNCVHYLKDLVEVEKNALENITSETKDLLEIVSQVNDKIQKLASSTQDISASTQTLADTMEKVRDEVESLASKE